jgi:hypothetical protein
MKPSTKRPLSCSVSPDLLLGLMGGLIISVALVRLHFFPQQIDVSRVSP